MASEGRTPRLAVLIDADNTSVGYADALFEEIATIGEATVRRIYGDFSGTRLRGWSAALSRLAIIPQHQQAYTKGKNSTDITLVIDAMTILYSGNVDGFSLVSSDSDFTRLASTIREHGLTVFGFGEQKTPESLRNACHRFIYLENLAVGGEDKPARGAPVAAQSRLPPSKAVPLIGRAIDAIDPEGGWVHLGEVGTQLNNLNPDFDPRSYGEKKLTDLVREAGAFEFRDNDQSKAVHIRRKAKSDQRSRRRAAS